MNANGYKYKMRGLPCRDALGVKMPYCVCGTESYIAADGTRVSGGGVLEWCYDHNDAVERMNMMRMDSRFSSLSVERS